MGEAEATVPIAGWLQGGSQQRRPPWTSMFHAHHQRKAHFQLALSSLINTTCTDIMPIIQV